MARAFLGGVAGALLLPGVAFASPDFPSTVRTHLDMSCTPKCSICHLTDPGLGSNANQVFAQTILGQVGERSLSPETLVEILDELAAAQTDSDEDGVSDIDELRGSSGEGSGQAGAGSSGATRDPSVVGAGDPCAGEVLYGCGAAQVAPAPAPRAWYGVAAVLGLFASLWFFRRVDGAPSRLD